MLATLRPPETTREVALEDGFAALDAYLKALSAGDEKAAQQAWTILQASRDRYDSSH